MGSIYQRKWKAKDGQYRTLPTLWIKYRQNGRTVCESTGTMNTTTARRMLRNREGDVEKGIPVNPKMGRITFEEAAADIENDYTVNKKKSLDHVKRRIAGALLPAFRGRRMLSITTDLIRQYVADRQRANAANATINRELAALKRMFTLAIQAGQLHGKPHIPMLKENNTRRGFFETEQFAAVREHLPEALRPVVAFAHITGWRVRSEVLGLEWRQVDWEGRVVRLDPGTTKNGDGRVFPFTAGLESLLRAQKADHDQRKRDGVIVRLVFHRDGQRIRNFRRAWVTACKAAGVPGRLVHDFRRTAVRNLERAGVSRSAAMAMVGHKTESIYRRYAIVDAGALRDAAAKIDAAMGTTVDTSEAAAASGGRQTA